MNAWQVFAAAVAVALAAIWSVLLLRLRTRLAAVMTSLVLALPTAGFAAYALSPGPLPYDPAVVFLAALLYGAMLLAAILRLLRRRPYSGSVAIAGAVGTQRRRLASRLLFVLWLHAFLFVFEPIYAAVGLGINALWLVIWIPRRWRSDTYSAIAEIPAPRAEVFDFLTDPGKWPLYRDGIEVTELVPPGRLGVGSEYTVRSAVPAAMANLSGGYRQVENHYRVTALVPNQSFTTSAHGGAEIENRTQLESTPAGTHVAVESNVTLSFEEACMGGAISLPVAQNVRRALDERRFAKLAEAISSTTSQ